MKSNGIKVNLEGPYLVVLRAHDVGHSPGQGSTSLHGMQSYISDANGHDLYVSNLINIYCWISIE